MVTVEPDAGVVARVKHLAAADARPALTDAEVKLSIQAHPKADADGLTWQEDGWTQTWDLYAIVSELWGVKAGKVAGDFNFAADDARYDKASVMEHCLAMEAKYGAMVMGSTGLAPRAYDPLKGVVVNG